MKYIIKDFEYYLNNERGLSKNTVLSYMTDLKGFESFLKRYHQLTAVRKIERKHIEGFLKRIKNKGLSAKTQARKLTTIKVFFHFLFIEKEIEEDIALQ